MLRKFINKMNSVTEFSGVIFLILMLAVLLLQVLCRFVLNHALAFPEEFARFTFLWATYAGISITLREASHLRIEILPVMVPSLEKVLRILCELTNLAFFTYFILLGYEMVLEIHDIGVDAVAIPIPMWIIWLGLPFYGVTSAINALANIIDLVTGYNEEKEAQS